MIIITFGTFDLFHYGHLRLLQRCLDMDGLTRLVVGVSSDALNHTKKNKMPIYTEAERMAIISNMKGVDEVFLEESLEKKQEYVDAFGADVLVMGDDWEGKFDHIKGCRVIYLPRTPSISTTEIIEKIRL
mgnify:CR=1 FL=1